MSVLTLRQAELADVGLALVAREGMNAVTFRSVAAESGWSLGAVQKAFTSKDELVRAMFIRLRESAGVEPPGEPGRPTLSGWLTELMLGMLPLDERRRAVTLQGAAFGDRAAFDPQIGRVIAASDAELRSLLAALVRRAQGEGEVSASIDPDAVAWAYLALAQGTTLQLLYDPMPEPQVRARTEAAVKALLGGDQQG